MNRFGCILCVREACFRSGINNVTLEVRTQPLLTFRHDAWLNFVIPCLCGGGWVCTLLPAMTWSVLYMYNTSQNTRSGTIKIRLYYITKTFCAPMIWSYCEGGGGVWVCTLWKAKRFYKRHNTKTKPFITEQKTIMKLKGIDMDHHIIRSLWKTKQLLNIQLLCVVLWAS